MLRYHRGTWREGDEMPDVAALDLFCKRYGWSYDQWCKTPWDKIEELRQVIEAEVMYQEEVNERQRINADRQRRGMAPLPDPRRPRATDHQGKSKSQIVREFMSD